MPTGKTGNHSWWETSEYGYTTPLSPSYMHVYMYLLHLTLQSLGDKYQKIHHQPGKYQFEHMYTSTSEIKIPEDTV